MLSRLTLALALLVFCTSSALARSTSNASQARDFPAPPVQARSAVVMDATNGQVLLAYNAHVRRPIASTTKIMTALLALQLGSLTDKIRVPKGAFNYESDATVMGLHPGQTVTLKDLLYGLMLPSGADAANTIAIHYAGSEAAWVKMMNHEAAVLNMHDTHYSDAHGLSDNSVSSAYDLAVLAQYASYLPDLMTIVSTRSYHWNGQTLVNLNRPLYWYPGVDGIKPGFTNEAGMCQVLDARRGGRHVVAAILNTPTLVIDARNLLNFGLRDYSWIQSALTGDSPSLTMKGTDASGPYTYFVSSGHYLRGKFVSGFANSGGLATLGYPRTEQLTQGKLRVQYFQNGVLALDTRTGKIGRLPIGTTISPAVKPTPTPTPTATRTPTPTPTPVEGSLPGHKPAAPSGPPTPRPTTKPTSTPVAPSTSGAKAVNRFQQTHARLLGAPVSALRSVRGYEVQIFQYGAVALDTRSHAIWLLPVGDRALSLLHYLAAHPGTAYPGGFAPASVLKAVGWLTSR